MNPDNYYKAGQITKLYGVKGEISINLNEPDLFEDYVFDVVFINPGGGLVPFFVSSYIFHSDKNILLLQLEGIDDPKSASRLINNTLCIASTDLPKPDQKQFFIHEVLGFVVTDLHFGELGLISEVMNLPMQQVFKINKDGKEILIPAADDIVVSIDRENKTILTDAPKGLIDLYLSGSEEEEE